MCAILFLGDSGERGNSVLHKGREIKARVSADDKIPVERRLHVLLSGQAVVVILLLPPAIRDREWVAAS